jgi:hypothetical protein
MKPKAWPWLYIHELKQTKISRLHKKTARRSSRPQHRSIIIHRRLPKQRSKATQLQGSPIEPRHVVKRFRRSRKKESVSLRKIGKLENMVASFLVRRGVVWLLWLLWTGPIVSSSSSSTSASAPSLSRRRIAEIYYMYGDENGTLPYDDDYNPPDGGTSAVELPSPVDDFVPLSCNANLPQATCVGWSVYFGTSAVHNARLLVRCGDCVTMDFGPSLTLNDGLDIHGKLVFPENYSITLYTAGIVVMGELEMQSTRAPITGTPLIRFVMIADDENRAFVPVGENAAACGRLALAGSSCLVGKKSITVAGGKMNGMCVSLLPLCFGAPTHTSFVFLSLCPVSSSPRHTRQFANVDPIVRRVGWDC